MPVIAIQLYYIESRLFSSHLVFFNCFFLKTSMPYLYKFSRDSKFAVFVDNENLVLEIHFCLH